MCYMEKFDIDKLNGLDYESGKKLLLKAGYSEKKGLENYETLYEECDLATDIYFVKECENKLSEFDRICCTVYSIEDNDIDDALENVLKTTWAKDDPRITKSGVLKNLKALIGKLIDYDEIICAFEDFDYEGATDVICEKSQSNKYEYVAYINSINSSSFIIKTDENNIITDVFL